MLTDDFALVSSERAAPLTSNGRESCASRATGDGNFGGEASKVAAKGVTALPVEKIKEVVEPVVGLGQFL